MFVRAYKINKNDIIILSKDNIYGKVKVGTKLYTNICSSKLFTYGDIKDECAIIIGKIPFKDNLSIFITIIKGAFKNLFTKCYKAEWNKDVGE